MKDDSSGPELVAMIEVDNVRFDRGVDLGIEFRNEIDAWKKMEIKFRSSRRFSERYGANDLRPLIYSIREKLD